MPVIAIINRKGGSGKSTLSTHIAAWCARDGLAVMLGDIDRQQSTRAWLRLRSPSLPPIAPWALDNKNTLRVPTGISHVVLDTPGGLHGFELARTVMFADAVLMPVCHSVFDRESAAACYAELQSLPRIASGRCRVAAVGMRLDGRTRAAEALAQWAQALGLPFLGVLRETQNYVRTVERGQTVFDLPERLGALDVAQWEPILAWLAPLLRPAMAANDAPGQPGATRAPQAALGTSRPSALMPQQESLVPGARLAAASSRSADAQRAGIAPRPQVLQAGTPLRSPSLLGNAPIPQFLKER